MVLGLLYGDLFYKFLNVCPFDCTAIAGKAKVGPLKPQVNHTVGMTIVAPADRPKTVHNSCVIERICSIFVSFHLCIVCRLGVFVIQLRQIISLFSFLLLRV